MSRRRKIKRIVDVKVLPGEPTDGSGRVCIHLFVQDEAGPFSEPCIMHPVLNDEGQPMKRRFTTRPTQGRLACDPKRTVAPVTRSGVTSVTIRTDDPRGVSCIKCLASSDYARMTAPVEQTVEE